MGDVEMSENGAEAKVEEVETKEEAMEEQQAQNGEEENEIYKLATSKKVKPDVAKELVQLFNDLSLTVEEFDERAIDALSNFNVQQAKFILGELKRCELFGVQNRPQFIMSVMRNFKDRVRQVSAADAVKNPLIPGPEVSAIKAIIDRTNYKLEVTVGQRKYHAPPNYEGPDPSQHGHEIFIGQIPKDIFEDKIIPLFEEVGTIYDLRLMLDPVMGKNRGYAFLVYCEKDHAGEAAKKFDGHEIAPGKHLKVNVSVANRRLFVGNIPKSKSKEEILEELKKHPELEGVSDVIIYNSPDASEHRKNRGFCFVDFADHKAASDARRRLMGGKVRPWNSDLVVDWAEQQVEPDEETMAQVKVLYVKNLKESVTEAQLEELYKPYGSFDRVKKIRDYAFVHFKDRESALKALEETKGKEVDGVEIDVSLAKPQVDNKQKKKSAIRGRPPMGGPRGARNGGSQGQYGGRYGQGYGPPGGYGAPGAYDPYYGSPGYYGAAPAYDQYYDPYYGQGGGYGGGRFSGGYNGGAQGGFRGGPRGSGGRGGRGGGAKRGRGAKRPGGQFDGPASKRGGRAEDFSSDVHPNTF